MIFHSIKVKYHSIKIIILHHQEKMSIMIKCKKKYDDAYKSSESKYREKEGVGHGRFANFSKFSTDL